MPYATLDDCKLRMGDALYAQLTDLEGGTTADDLVGQARLDDAHGQVNMHLSARYLTPVETAGNDVVAETLRSIVCSFAAWQCFVKHPRKSGRMRAAVEADYREARDLLIRITSGDAALPGATPLPGPASGGPSAEATGHVRVFTEDSMEGL